MTQKIDWKSCVVGIILSTLVLIALNLFVIPEPKSSLKKMQDDVMSCPYFITEYQANIFDCSNMANMLDKWLESKGYESWILIFSKINPLEGGHAIIMVYGQLFEPTTKTFRTLIGGIPIMMGDTMFYPPNLADGTYSNQITIVDDPTQLPFYQESEWSYPKRW